MPLGVLGEYGKALLAYSPNSLKYFFFFFFYFTTCHRTSPVVRGSKTILGIFLFTIHKAQNTMMKQ
jgi:hypothetical protein